MSLPARLATAELVRHALAGGDAALEVLVARYRPRLARWASGRLPLPARALLDTEDLVQETLLASVRHLPRLEVPAAFPAYLRRTLLNRLQDLRRKFRKVWQTPLDDGPELEDGHPTQLASLLGRELEERYRRALAVLPPRDRRAILAKLDLDLSYREVAAELDLASADAARMVVNRALIRLARLMIR